MPITTSHCVLYATRASSEFLIRLSRAHSFKYPFVFFFVPINFRSEAESRKHICVLLLSGGRSVLRLCSFLLRNSFSSSNEIKISSHHNWAQNGNHKSRQLSFNSMIISICCWCYLKGFYLIEAFKIRLSYERSVRTTGKNQKSRLCFWELSSDYGVLMCNSSKMLHQLDALSANKRKFFFRLLWAFTVFKALSLSKLLGTVWWMSKPSVKLSAMME